jgi:hypothetical protein
VTAQRIRGPRGGEPNSGSHYGGYDTTPYYLTYTDNNSNSLITLCLDNGVTWYCGWGSGNTVTGSFSHQYAGRNSGF